MQPLYPYLRLIGFEIFCPMRFPQCSLNFHIPALHILLQGLLNPIFVFLQSFLNRCVLAFFVFQSLLNLILVKQMKIWFTVPMNMGYITCAHSITCQRRERQPLTPFSKKTSEVL